LVCRGVEHGRVKTRNLLVREQAIVVRRYLCSPYGLTSIASTTMFAAVEDEFLVPVPEHTPSRSRDRREAHCV
jgi:hypothetical protein